VSESESMISFEDIVEFLPFLLSEPEPLPRDFLGLGLRLGSYSVSSSEESTGGGYLGCFPSVSEVPVGLIFSGSLGLSSKGLSGAIREGMTIGFRIPGLWGSGDECCLFSLLGIPGEGLGEGLGDGVG